MSNEFQMYHYEIVDSAESDEAAAQEQEMSDEHQKKIMEFVDRLENILARSQLCVPTPASTKDRLIDRQLDVIEGSMKTAQRDLEKPESIDIHVLLDYSHEIKGLEGELQGVMKDVLSLDDFEERLERVSNIKCILSKLRITISRLTEEIKKEPESREAIRIPMVSGINLPRIDIPTFDGNILNWRLFWEQFQAAVHDKEHLGEIDKLTYLRDALKDGPAKNVIQGLTQSAESYQEAIRCLKERYERPRLTHRKHVTEGNCEGFMTIGINTLGRLKLSVPMTLTPSLRP